MSVLYGKLLHVLLALIALAGLGLTLAFLFSDMLAIALQDGGQSLRITVFQRLIRQYPQGLQIARWSLFQTGIVLVVVNACVLLVLAKPIRQSELYSLLSAFLCLAWGNGLYLYYFGLGLADSAGLTMYVVPFSFLLHSVAGYLFTRSFQHYPAPYSLERIVQARRIAERNASLRSRRKGYKSNWLGRLRRALMAWQRRREHRNSALVRQRKAEEDRIRRWSFSLYEHPVWIPVFLFMGLAIQNVGEFTSFDVPRVVRGLAGVVVMYCIVFGVSLTALKIYADYLLGTNEIKRRVLWLLLGLYVPFLIYMFAFWAGLMLVVFFPTFARLDLLISAPFFFMPSFMFGSFAVAVLVSIHLFGTFDPARTIRASTLYGALGVLLTTIFVVAENLLSPLIAQFTGLPGYSGSVIAGSAAAFLFSPVRLWVERRLENCIAGLIETQSGPAVISCDNIAGTDRLVTEENLRSS